MKNLVLDVTMRELARHGIKPECSREGKHIKLRWKNKQGQERWVGVPCTPGESKRSHLNNRAWVRRILSKDGMLLV